MPKEIQITNIPVNGVVITIDIVLITIIIGITTKYSLMNI